VSRKLLYVFAAVLGFVGFILVYAPARPLWGFISDDVGRQAPHLQVRAVGGTVWQGQADIQFLPPVPSGVPPSGVPPSGMPPSGMPPSRLAWRLAPAGLLAGELRLMLDLAGAGHQLQARTSLTPAQLVVHNLAGEVQASYLQPLATPYGLGLSGALEIRNITLTSAGNWLASAAGHLQWTGGRLEFPTPLGPQQIYLPAMQGNISLQGDNLALEVLTQAVAGGEPILTILVKPTGWVEVAIKARLFKLAQLPWPATAGLDATALTVEEKLF
jgi:hypothetical protein